MGGIGERATGCAIAGSGVAVLAILLIANPFGLGVIPSSRTAPPTRPALASASSAEAEPELAVLVPPSDLVGTANVVLEARWEGPPAGCSLAPAWFSWFLPPGGPARGTFQDPNRALATFVPATLTSGTSEVGVRSTVEVSCGASNGSLTRTAYGNVSAYPPLGMTNLSVGPSATGVPGAVNLTGDLEGGRPPYRLYVTWGDGGSTYLTLPTPGSFRLDHTLPAGTFRPGMNVVDGEGFEVHETVPEPADASNGTVLEIRPSAPLAEVGLPVEFTGTVLRASTPAGVDIGCNPGFVVPPRSNVTNVTCWPTVPGFLPVTLKYAASTPTGSLETTRDEPVAPPVAVVVRPTDPVLEAGIPTFVRVTVSGGVPPFDVVCSSAEGPFVPLPMARADGDFLVAWTPSVAGPSALTASVRDALGASAAGPWTAVSVLSPPEHLIRTHTAVNPSGTTVTVESTVAGGSNGTLWAVGTDPAPVQDSLPFGVVSGGAFGWAASFVHEGLANLEVVLLDPAGDLVRANATVALPVPVAAHAAVLPDPSAVVPSVRILLTIAGGVAPFSVWVNGSDGPRWNGSDPAAGSDVIVAPLGGWGTVNLTVTVSDARGSRSTVALVVTVPTPAHTLGEGGGPPWTAAAAMMVVGVLLGSIAVMRWRRRGLPSSLPPLDPEAVLERLIAPADGADRLTIELMAEEEGISLATVRATLDRLVAEGRVLSESDAEGGEVLSWASAADS